jgi:Domain of unknown function (DUF4129)
MIRGVSFSGWMVIVLLLLGTHSLRADTPVPPVTDPAQIQSHYKQVLAQPQYQDTDESPIDTRFEDWLSQWFKSLGAKFGEFKYATQMPAFESLLMTLLVVFCLAGLLYIMGRVIRRRAGMEPEPLADSPGSKTFRSPEFYDHEINQALRAGDWHGAWLAAWRQFLSRLEHRHLVEPDRTRTNREYLAQLHAHALPGAALTLVTGMVDAYDRFIYGRKSIGELEWHHFHGQIDEATLLLNLEDKKVTATPGTAT